MKLKLTTAQITALKAFLARFEDAESLSEGEYVVDLYDLEMPMSLDLVFVNGGVAVDGAAELRFDPALDGWYMGRRVEDPEEVRRALEQAGAFEA